MRYPDFISDKKQENSFIKYSKNNTIGFVAPSFGAAIEPYKSCFNNALKTFDKLGIKYICGPNCYEGCGIGISNTPQLCGRELMDMYIDENNSMLISCGGGELMCEILEYIDWEKLKNARPKWYVGYSDNTNFTFLETVLCDTASIYGVCAGAFGMEPWHDSVKDLYEMIIGQNACLDEEGNVQFKLCGYDKWQSESLKDEENPLATINATEKSVIRCYDKGVRVGKSSTSEELDDNFKMNYSGRLIGGCMDCLVNILGTKYDKVEEFIEKYKEDGFVWFIESCDLNVFAIRRAMWQMDNAGWFKYVKGFVIGRPMVQGQTMMGLDQYEAVMGIIGKYNVPVIMDADIGHVSPDMPIICGSYGEIEVYGKKYSITMKLK